MKKMTSMLIGLTILTFGLPGAHGADPPHPAVLIPAEIELGLRAPGSTTQSSLWIVNTGDEPLELVDGMITVPQGPGLGVEVDRAKLERYQVT